MLQCRRISCSEIGFLSRIQMASVWSENAETYLLNGHEICFAVYLTVITLCCSMMSMKLLLIDSDSDYTVNQP